MHHKRFLRFDTIFTTIHLFGLCGKQVQYLLVILKIKIKRGSCSVPLTYEQDRSVCIDSVVSDKLMQRTTSYHSSLALITVSQISQTTSQRHTFSRLSILHLPVTTVYNLRPLLPSITKTPQQLLLCIVDETLRRASQQPEESSHP